jgi:hypothetical protein
VKTVAPSFAGVLLSVDAHGQVLVELAIDAAGDVISAKASEGHPQLRAATETALAQWKFIPSVEPVRTVKLVLEYPRIIDDLSDEVVVYSYDLKLAFRRPEVINTVPKDWKPNSTECDLHHVPFERGRVSVGYGAWFGPPGYYEAVKHFPNAKFSWEAGCIIRTDRETGEFAPKYAEVLFCPKCRAAEEKWAAEHSNPWRK